MHPAATGGPKWRLRRDTADTAAIAWFGGADRRSAGSAVAEAINLVRVIRLRLVDSGLEVGMAIDEGEVLAAIVPDALSGRCGSSPARSGILAMEHDRVRRRIIEGECDRARRRGG